MQKPTAEALQPVVLRHRGKVDYSAAVTPLYGANLVSLQADGVEYMHYDAALLLRGEKYIGAFNMFPTPCRLANCAYEFDGKKIVQNKRGEQVFIHGLVRDEPFAFTAEPSRVTSRMEIKPGSPVFEGFPFESVFTVIHALDDNGLTVTFRVENRGKCRMPFGYGIHPWWKVHGSRKELRLRIPCAGTLESKDLVPTGGVKPVEGTPLDFRKAKPLADLVPDNVFFKREAGETGEIFYDFLGRRLVIEASAHFPHMIVYTATPDAPFVCVENLTTAPNGQNLAAKGDNSVANVLIANPGETVEGWVRYSVRPAAG